MLQTALTKVYRGLHAQQAKMSFRLKDVKSSVVLDPMSPEDLAHPIRSILEASLRSAGWTSLPHGRLLSCNYFKAKRGKVAECYCLDKLDILIEPPNSILLLVHPCKPLSDPGCLSFFKMCCHEGGGEESE